MTAHTPIKPPRGLQEAAEVANAQGVTVEVKRAGAVYRITPTVQLAPIESATGVTCDDLFNEASN